MITSKCPIRLLVVVLAASLLVDPATASAFALTSSTPGRHDAAILTVFNHEALSTCSLRSAHLMLENGAVWAKRRFLGHQFIADEKINDMVRATRRSLWRTTAFLIVAVTVLSTLYPLIWDAILDDKWNTIPYYAYLRAASLPAILVAYLADWKIDLAIRDHKVDFTFAVRAHYIESTLKSKALDKSLTGWANQIHKNAPAFSFGRLDGPVQLFRQGLFVASATVMLIVFNGWLAIWALSSSLVIGDLLKRYRKPLGELQETKTNVEGGFISRLEKLPQSMLDAMGVDGVMQQFVYPDLKRIAELDKRRNALDAWSDAVSYTSLDFVLDSGLAGFLLVWRLHFGTPDLGDIFAITMLTSMMRDPMLSILGHLVEWTESLGQERGIHQLLAETPSQSNLVIPNASISNEPYSLTPPPPMKPKGKKARSSVLTLRNLLVLGLQVGAALFGASSYSLMSVLPFPIKDPSKRPSAVEDPNRIYKERDVIHGLIHYNAKERRFIKDRILRRLRGTAQTGLAAELYMNATHKRYPHMMGTMHLAGLAFDVITDIHRQPLASVRALIESHRDELAYCRQAVRLAALLHDVGQPYLSHGGEKTAFPKGWPHERMNHVLITDPRLQEDWKSIGMDPMFVSKLAMGPKLWRKFGDGSTFSDWECILSEIITGEFGVDRMDYLRRDKHFAGPFYGEIDTAQLIESMRILPVRSRKKERFVLGITEDGIVPLRQLLRARRDMFKTVYRHPKVKYWEILFDRFAPKFVTKWVQERGPLTNPKSFLRLTDIEVLAALNVAAYDANPPDEDAFALAEGQVFKVVFEAEASDWAKAGGQPAFKVWSALKRVKDFEGIPFEYTTDELIVNNSLNIPILLDDGRVVFSPTIPDLESPEPVQAGFVFCPPDRFQEVSLWVAKNREQILSKPWKEQIQLELTWDAQPSIEENRVKAMDPTLNFVKRMASGNHGEAYLVQRADRQLATMKFAGGRIGKSVDRNSEKTKAIRESAEYVLALEADRLELLKSTGFVPELYKIYEERTEENERYAKGLLREYIAGETAVKALRKRLITAEEFTEQFWRMVYAFDELGFWLWDADPGTNLRVMARKLFNIDVGIMFPANLDPDERENYLEGMKVTLAQILASMTRRRSPSNVRSIRSAA